MVEYGEYELINYISASAECNKDQVIDLVNKKIRSFDGMISKIGAVHLVAKDLKVSLAKTNHGTQMAMAGVRQNHRVEEYISARGELVFGLDKLDDHDFKKLSVKSKDNILEVMLRLNKTMRDSE